MTLEEYYKILAEEWDRVHKDNLQEIRQYNRMKRDLRRIVDEEENRRYNIYTN